LELTSAAQFSCVVTEMHRSLLISEVVANICYELAGYHHPICPGSLAAFAATCRAMSEPALDVLWHAQSSLGPLLRCMPSDLWEAIERENGKTYLVGHWFCDKFVTVIASFSNHFYSVSADQLSPQIGTGC